MKYTKQIAFIEHHIGKVQAEIIARVASEKKNWTRRELLALITETFTKGTDTMNLETLSDTGEIRLLKGSMSILEFAAMRLRILGDVRQAKIVDKQSIEIRRYLEAQETGAGAQ